MGVPKTKTKRRSAISEKHHFSEDIKSFAIITHPLTEDLGRKRSLSGFRTKWRGPSAHSAGVISSWPATGPEVATAFMHPGGCVQTAAGVPACQRGVQQELGRGWRPQVSEARVGKVFSGMAGRAGAREGRDVEGTTPRVGDCWAAEVPRRCGHCPSPRPEARPPGPSLGVGG